MARRMVSFWLEDEVITWLDDNAKRLSMNRTSYLEFLFTQSKPLMEAIGPTIDALADQYIKKRKEEMIQQEPKC